jgi:hypothetical protein
LSGKNHNSILFLTTLGVYLGLVLVGATPQVLAQAATAKQFNVKDEIGKKDNLDDNPNLNSSAEVLETYFFHVEEFLERLSELVRSAEPTDTRSYIEITRSSAVPCVGHTGVVLSEKLFAPEIVWDSAIRFSDLMLSRGTSLGDCLPSFFHDGRPGTVTRSRTVFEDDQLVIELHVRKASWIRAQDLLGDLQRALRDYDSTDATKARVQLMRYTKFLSDSGNDGVLIYTALPRGSLDTLLASNAQ